MYDYDTEELLCKDNNNILCSLDGNYKYEIKSKEENIKSGNMSKEFIENKMNEENNLLNKKDIKILRKNKLLRY